MANLKAITKKLQKAILQTGLVIKMGSTQFYSQEQQRMITIYILSTTIIQRNQSGEWTDKNYEILRSASDVEIVRCLSDIWQQVKGRK